MATSHPNDAYQVGWISALHIERAAAESMLDEKHGRPQSPLFRDDANSYVLGRIHEHNVVIACLPLGEVGPSSTAVCAGHMMSSFPNIRIGLLVGIGAGLPTYHRPGAQADRQNSKHQQVRQDFQGATTVASATSKPQPPPPGRRGFRRWKELLHSSRGGLPAQQLVPSFANQVQADPPFESPPEYTREEVGSTDVDIRLGDVVISSDKMSGGLIAYNFGRRLGDGSFQTAYHLNQPPRVLRTAVSSLRAAHETGESLIPNYLISMLQHISAAKRAGWKHPGQDRRLLSNHISSSGRPIVRQLQHGKGNTKKASRQY